MTTTTTLDRTYQYIRLAAGPYSSRDSVPDALALRKRIADGLARAYGLSFAGTYLDILSLSVSRSSTDGDIVSAQARKEQEDGRWFADAVIRVAAAWVSS